MARAKSSQSRKPISAVSNSNISSRATTYLSDLWERPASRYVAAGLATALVAKVTSKITERYPEITNFLKENVPEVGDRLEQFRNGSVRTADINH